MDNKDFIIENKVLKDYTGKGTPKFNIPNGVTEISEIFYHLSPLIAESIKELYIPKSVKVIGRNAFPNLGITSLTIPDGVTEIGEYAFYNCESLVEVYIPNSVKVIGQGAFGRCKKIKKITLPKRFKYKIEDFMDFERIKLFGIFGSCKYKYI